MKKGYLTFLSLLSTFCLLSCGTTPEASSIDNSSSEKENSQSTSTSSVDGNTSSQNSSKSSSNSRSSSTPVDITHLPAINYIKVLCPTDYTNIYAWLDDKTKLLGDWPGSSTALKSYDNNWKYYDFDPSLTSVNFIFNKPASGQQTGDLSAEEAGYYWYFNNSIVFQDFDPKIYGTSISSSTKQGNYEIVDYAGDYNDLPAVKKFANNSIVNKYNGNRNDFRDESIYFLMTTRFYDGDSSNNAHCWEGTSKGLNTNDPEWRGDFKGLIQKMDYIKALGFTSIWITPVVKNASGYDYHGYHAINFKEVDPRYLSDNTNFQDVINEAHKRDMKIVLDVVFNHTGNFGEENLFPMFNYNPGEDASINGIKRSDEYGILNKSYDSKNGEQQYQARIEAMKNDSSDPYHIYHHEKSFGYEQYTEQTGQMAGDCVDLNTENPTVANYLVEAYGKYIQMGVDAFRIDTMKHISRYTLNKYYFPAFMKIAETVGNPNFHMFGEVCSRWNGSTWNHDNPNCSAPFYTWNENKDYPWGSREENEETTKTFYNANTVSNQPSSKNHLLSGVTYHSPDTTRFNHNGVIDFQMHWAFENARSAFGVATGWDHTYQDATYNVVYVDSHDYGPGSQEKTRYQGGTNNWKDNMSLMFTFRGIPCLYYGSEVEFKNDVPIDVGPNADLENTGRAYFGDYLEGNVKASGFGSYVETDTNGTIKQTLNSTLSKHLQKLSKARLQCIALRRGQYSTSNVSGSALAFTRRYTVGNTDSLALIAIDGSASFNNLPNGTYKDLYNDKTYTVSNGTVHVDAGSHGVCILVKQ